MEQRPKYYPKPPIPAVELSLRPVEVGMPTSPSPKAPNPRPPIDLDGDGSDTVKGDENDLQVMEDEGGNGGPARYPVERASPASPVERKH